MFKLLFLAFCSIALPLSFGQDKGGRDGKIIYKYKQFEKFDFENIDIGGENTSTGDLSITPRFQRKFENKLPLRRNFNPEIRDAVNNIR